MIQSIDKNAVIIGGGVAGLKAAATLSRMGIGVTLFERQEKNGGHLARWHKLFPAIQDAETVLKPLLSAINTKNIVVQNNSAVKGFRRKGSQWEVVTDAGSTVADAVLLATGFDLFDARLKEEYGYGIYPAVITSEELEQVFSRKADFPFDTSKENLKIGMVHCVGSRDAKCGNTYCSKVCCITAVKQAIELRKMFPRSTVYCFYMDVRMFGTGYEELYHEAQTAYNIQFVRGRLSEASPAHDDTVQVKAEDTLLGLQLKASLDMLVLMVGMTPAHKLVMNGDDIQLVSPAFGDVFYQPLDGFMNANVLNADGVFVAGASKGPASIPDVLQDAQAAAIEVYNYLKR
ncbi:MAG: FAD-dependent oxidoreductase [Cytophagaceae bacterium]|jgi:heterodisulfide reductase subunit A|nr:FAD-dependent oxidoreductase [Cytophagaceae bacterium]